MRVVGHLLRLTQSFLGPRSPLCISLVSAPRTNLSKRAQPCPVPLQDSSRPLSPAWGVSEPQCLCVGVFPTQSLAPATTAPFCWPRGPVLKCWRGTSALPDLVLTASLLLPLSCLLLSGFGSVACGGLAHPIPAAEELSLNFRDPPGAAELPLLQIVYQSDSSPLQPVPWSHALCWGLSPSCLQPSSPPCAFLSLPGSASSLLSPRAPAKSRAYRAKRPSPAPRVPRRANPAPCRDGRSS